MFCVVNVELFKCFVVVDDMLFCIVTFNLWLHYNKLLTYLLTYLRDVFISIHAFIPRIVTGINI